jgi:hypothetical protein
MRMRVNPNTDVLGGSVNLTVDGRQHTVRLSRVWRPDCETRVGPLRFAFLEPFKDLHLTMAPNASPVAFDLHWRGVAPAFLEDHHHLTWRGRVLCDQSRYVQVGSPEGWIEVEGARLEVDPVTWCGARDHSWGLYEQIRPLAGLAEHLPPAKPPSERALRFWTLFRLPRYAGFFSFREDKDGVCRDFANDMDGKGFEGAIDQGWEGPRLGLVSARHELTFKPGTRVLTGGRVWVTDAEGGEWLQEIEVATPPSLLSVTGRSPGSWSDGGTTHTYHGDGPVMEWETTDVSQMPRYQRPGMAPQEAKGSMQYGARVRMRAPDGAVSEGLQHVTLAITGDYRPYGFSAAAD